MLTVEEAMSLVLEAAQPLPASETLTESSLGRVLAESVTADIDCPPFDKSMVDGFAIRCADLANGPADFAVVATMTAGFSYEDLLAEYKGTSPVPKTLVSEGQAAQIMTGARIPPGADAVVMVEKTEMAPGSDRVRINEVARPGQNIARQGQSIRTGDVLVNDGTLIRPIELGLLAESGRKQVLTVSKPRVAVVATGDELIPFASKPRGGLIRNTNSPMLCALVRNVGVSAFDHGIVKDHDTVKRPFASGQRIEEDVSTAVVVHRDSGQSPLEEALSLDVVILSGGVSVGIRDYVPKWMEVLGVREIFHKVNLKPGKPLWFGVKDHGQRRTLVFGLPGNPVSSLVCFELFVRPALNKLAGQKECVQRLVQAALTKEHVQRGERIAYWPSRLEEAADGARQVTPLLWKGSGDLRTLADANALAIFPGGDRNYERGATVGVLQV